MKATDGKAQAEVQDEIGEVASGDKSKIGTWISVGVVGAVILATYFILFGLYMARV
ncbi:MULTISPECIES: hypothetical protein [unclassified Bacillus (in: firmicutes)]|uniref:hypothetical protein n=1 Tax=unclassified Bacillus (in: firmicutes) TaxID=185979 RepID=UPI001BE7BE5B|nr:MULTISPECIES: hypothetical protein [unclassified Bacillus (in: firmicutes)]MBT2640030.1 hypothetical protein [Bacillus sp. ISL-39]MBT2662831.1 hypothetical protein [Bacillus sp. ISL-45]